MPKLKLASAESIVGISDEGWCQSGLGIRSTTLQDWFWRISYRFPRERFYILMVIIEGSLVWLHDQSLHQKIKFSIEDFFSKCDQIRIFLWIWSHLLKKSLMENLIFWAARSVIFIPNLEHILHKSNVILLMLILLILMLFFTLNM